MGAEVPLAGRTLVALPSWLAPAAAELPAWPRLRFGCPFPEASEGMPGFRNPCGQLEAPVACAELSKGCGHEIVESRSPRTFPPSPTLAAATCV
eukprot:11536580-Heterocapsa_arctica.AAC.1